MIAADQADIAVATKTGGIVRSFRVVWTPQVGDLPTATTTGTRILDFPVDLTPVVKPWLDPAYADWFVTPRNETLPAVQAVKRAMTIRLALDGWTLGNDLPAIAAEPNVGSLGHPAGLVVRDPALATVRLCRGACTDERGRVVDTTDDLQPPSRMALSQLGRMDVLPLSSGLFDKSNLVVALNADGSIASLGTQLSNTAATNLATVGQIADAITSGRTNRNAQAIAAANYADTVNKALADCLTQQEIIRKAGATPAPCQ